MIDFRFRTAFRNNLTDEEEVALDHLLDMMTAIKQQILLRRAMKEESNVYRLKDNQFEDAVENSEGRFFYSNDFCSMVKEKK